MSKYHLIIDCDTGIDDALALLLAGLSKEIELIAISVCGGNTEMINAYHNSRRILHLLGLDIPVIKGLTKPLDRPLETAAETHGQDGFGEISAYFDRRYGYDASRDGAEYDLVTFYRRAFEQYEDLVLLSIGPMTNIAYLLKTLPEEFKKLKRLVSMGGNYKSYGNTSPLAEYNYWVDPQAGNYVYLHSPILVEMVGLDVTRKILLNDQRQAAFKASNPLLGDFIANLTRFYYDFHWQYEAIRGCVINDPLALLAILDDQLLSGFSSFTQVESLGLARGISIVDDHHFYKQKPNSIVYTDVDVEGFFTLANQILRGEK